VRDHRCRGVYSERAPRHRSARRIESGLSGSTADVEHTLFATYVARSMQELVVQTQLSIVVHGIDRTPRQAL
jgi:hypothetical protein